MIEVVSNKIDMTQYEGGEKILQDNYLVFLTKVIMIGQKIFSFIDG
jgi:hypothetical protein